MTKRLICMNEVAHRTSLSRTGINRAIKAGKFVRPCRFGCRKMFPEDEVEKWIEERKSSR